MKIFTPRTALFFALASLYTSFLLLVIATRDSNNQNNGFEVEALKSKHGKERKSISLHELASSDETREENIEKRNQQHGAKQAQEDAPKKSDENSAKKAETANSPLETSLDPIKKAENEFDSQGGAFFGPPSINEKCSSLPAVKPSSFFSEIGKSARVVCEKLTFANSNLKKLLSEADKAGGAAAARKVTEYTGQLTSSLSVSIQHFQNIVLPIEFGNEQLQDLTCSSVESSSSSSSSSGIHITNTKGDKIRPEWYASQQQELDQKQKEANGGDDQQDVDFVPDASNTKFETYERPVFRVDRDRPGNLLGNFEILFNIFVATKSLPEAVFKSNKDNNNKNNKNNQFRIIFKDQTDTIRWGDVTMFRNFVEDPLKDLLFEDTWKETMQKYGIDPAHKKIPHKNNDKKQKGQDNKKNKNDDDEKQELQKQQQSKSRNQQKPRKGALLEFSSLIEFSSFPLTTTSPTASSSIFCPSPIFQNFVDWLYQTSGADPRPRKRDRTDRRLRVLWASRGPLRDRYQSRTMYLPKRRLRDEMQFTLDLADELGPGVELQVVEFGEQGFHESVLPVRDSDVLVGIHGAGLTWSAFLPRGKSALVEIFTHDLLQGKKSSDEDDKKNGVESLETISPYRRIAAWNGIEYASVKLRDTKYVDPPFTLPFEGEQKELFWTEEDVRNIAATIKEKLKFRKNVLEKHRWCV